MDWSQIASDFCLDGSLRDIYILDTSRDDWARVWDVLTIDPRKIEFKVNGELATPPTLVDEVFRLQETSSVLATYALGKQRLNCHFFTEEEVELDLDPRDIDGMVEVEQLATFLVTLGTATSREVRLTPENEPETIIACYDPAIASVVWSRLTT